MGAHCVSLRSKKRKNFKLVLTHSAVTDKPIPAMEVIKECDVKFGEHIALVGQILPSTKCEADCTNAVNLTNLHVTQPVGPLKTSNPITPARITIHSDDGHSKWKSIKGHIVDQSMLQRITQQPHPSPSILPSSYLTSCSVSEKILISLSEAMQRYAGNVVNTALSTWAERLNFSLYKFDANSIGESPPLGWPHS